MNTYKKVLFIILCLSLFIKPFLGQIIPDKTIYTRGSFPSVSMIGDSTLLLAYSDIYTGVKFLPLDTLLNTLQDTFTINEPGSTSPCIDIRNNMIALCWTANYVMYDEIYSTVFDYGTIPEIDTVLRLGKVPSDNNLGGSQNCFINDSTILTVWYGATAGDKYKIWGRFSSISNQPFGSAFIINEEDQAEIDHKRPRVCSFPSDSGFVVTWIDDRGGEEQIYGRLFSAEGMAKDSSFLITDSLHFSNEFYYTCLKMDNNGNFVVTWSNSVNSVWNIYYRWYNKDGMPLTPIVTLTNESDKVNGYSDVDCHIQNDGKIVMIWESDKDTYWRVYAQRFSSDRTPLDEPFEISSDARPYNQYTGKVLLHNDKIYTFWAESTLDLWVNVLDFNNPVVSIAENTLPTHFTLSQNYPNPFNPITTIGFQVPESSHVTLQIFDITGRLVETLVNNFKEAGNWDVKWNAGNYSSGIYIYRLEYLDKHISRKMLLIK